MEGRDTDRTQQNAPAMSSSDRPMPDQDQEDGRHRHRCSLGPRQFPSFSSLETHHRRRRRSHRRGAAKGRVGSTRGLLLLLVVAVTMMVARTWKTTSTTTTATLSPSRGRSSVGVGVVAAFAGPPVCLHRRRLQGRILVSSTTTNVNAHAKDLLYQVQEQMLVDQGVHEESIMKEHVFPLAETARTTTSTSSAAIATTTTRQSKNKGSSRRAGSGVGGGGGFGSSEKRPRQRRRRVHKAPLPVDVEPYLEGIKNDGVVRINSVLPVDVACDMREWVVQYRAESQQLVQEGQVRVQDRFADVLLKHNRCDMTLPLGTDPIVMDALYHVLCQSSVLPAALRSAFGSEDPVLYELSTLISDPGSQRQVVHPDNPIQADIFHNEKIMEASLVASISTPVLLTCFVALQDVTPDMGPTVYLPGTNTLEAHQQFFSSDPAEKENLLQSNPKWLGLLRQGDCSLYDSRVLHCGSANRHPTESRALFYMSFRNPKIIDPGNPPSIRRDVAARQLTLSQLQDLLIEHWTA